MSWEKTIRKQYVHAVGTNQIAVCSLNVSEADNLRDCPMWRIEEALEMAYSIVDTFGTAIGPRSNWRSLDREFWPTQGLPIKLVSVIFRVLRSSPGSVSADAGLFKSRI